MRLALITPSFSRDAALCAELCRSIDAHDRDGLEHVVVVPRADLPLFRGLAGGRRRVIAQETILPQTLVRLPLPTVLRLPGLGTKRLRKIWITPRLQMVRGWMLQQVLKMSADRIAEAEGFVFIDSDAVMVRDFGAASFLRDGRLPLHRVPDAVPAGEPAYQRWQDTACDLLGLPRFPFEGESLISTVVCWRRDRLAELQARIAEVAGRPFQSALMDCRHMSEYVVYALFCRHLVEGDTGHYPQDDAICLEDWCFDLSTEAGMAAFQSGLEPHHLAVLIQSTSEWPVERRRAVVETIRRNAGLA